ncbi:peptide deformylase [Campylobacter sp. MG1]|uniref:peptide deformylase n=1 Tax=Campylobacter sp. MG1 TaxID=2976332 RepID=UPI00226CCFD0|nr:peptide deformylase [Campylobacter sp. MG1]
MILDILKYPNKALFVRSEEVKDFDANLHELLDNMYDTMIISSGIGLAAIQVGKPFRIFIINLINDNEVQDKNDLIEFINPKITPLDDKTQIYEEGCLSVPGFFEEVIRHENIRVDFYDRYGNISTLEASGLLSVAIQHENDHLDGHLFIEKIGYQARKKLEKYLKENKKSKK